MYIWYAESHAIGKHRVAKQHSTLPKEATALKGLGFFLALVAPSPGDTKKDFIFGAHARASKAHTTQQKLITSVGRKSKCQSPVGLLFVLAKPSNLKIR
jgi:hypothetical protein